MKDDDPRHGRPSGYGLGCRCGPCSLRWTRKNKRWALRAERNGGRTTVDATTFLADLTALTEHMSRTAISEAIGASSGYISRLLRGDITAVSLARADAIRRLLDTTSPFANTGAYVSSTPSTRRLRALTAIGYSQYKLAEITGLSRNAIIAILHAQAPMIHGGTHAQIKDAFDRFHMTPPTSATPQGAAGATRARNLARSNDWAPPAAWNNIDDPDEQPSGHRVCAAPDCALEVVYKDLCRPHYAQTWKGRELTPLLPEDDAAIVERILAGDWRMPCTSADKTAVCRRWVALGGSLNDLERLTGWTQITRYFRLKDAS